MSTTGPRQDRSGPFASSWRRRHLTVDQRVARGRAARVEAPRSGHGVARDYCVRQFQDWKGSADVEAMLAPI